MSELQRSFAKTHLARLPPEAPIIFDERDEDEDEEEEEEEYAHEVHARSASDSSASSASTIVPSPTKHLFEKPKSVSSKPSSSRWSPLGWTGFFHTRLYFERQIPDFKVTHHVYLTPPLPSGPLFVTHHGAGSSGLSFACFASEIHKAIPTAGILSLDARGHGRTEIERSKPSKDDIAQAVDLSLDTLGSDLAFVVQAVKAKMGWPTLPEIILIGHSLGGAVVVEVANRGLLASAMLGYAVLDVVEGSAMEALAHMETYLSNRPSSFPSLASAIEWHTRSRTIRNPRSARASVPSLLTSTTTNTTRIATPSSTSPTTPSSFSKYDSSSQTTDPPPDLPQTPPTTTTYTWLTPLTPTKPYWPTWFHDLSNKFLTSRGAKLLILAGTDRLDKPLMIGQMQGKYELQVFPDAGHFVHEDQPEKVAAVVAEFWRRNARGVGLVLPPKVGQREK